MNLGYYMNFVGAVCGGAILGLGADLQLGVVAVTGAVILIGFIFKAAHDCD
jgi:hypothetical protein